MLDVMPMDWNVSDNFLKYLSSERDIVEVGKDWKRQVYNNTYGYEGGLELQISSNQQPQLCSHKMKTSHSLILWQAFVLQHDI